MNKPLVHLDFDQEVRSSVAPQKLPERPLPPPPKKKNGFYFDLGSTLNPWLLKSLTATMRMVNKKFGLLLANRLRTVTYYSLSI